MEHTRRAYLASTGALAIGSVGLAGCLGSSSSGSNGGGESEPDETSHNCELSERDPVDELPQPRLGSDDAAVTVAVFEDFACPHCADFALGPFAELKAEFADDDDVAFEHYDLPIPVSDWSTRVANAARSVQDAADDEAFFAFSEAAYENLDDYSWQVVGDIADEVGVDPCRALSDATNETYEAVLEANRDEAEDRGVDSTPTVFVNGEPTETSESAISEAIEANRDS